jgi:hypothetical protein
VVFAALAVVNSLDQLDEGGARFAGPLLGSAVLATGLGMLVRFLYFRYLDRAERRAWSPWALVIGSFVLLATIGGQVARRDREVRSEVSDLKTACAGEPLEAGFRRLPRPLSYGEPPPALRREFEDEFPAAYREVVRFRLVFDRGRRAGAVFLMPTKDSQKTIDEMIDGASEAAGHTLERTDIGVDGRSWTRADVGTGDMLLAPVGCRVVALFVQDLAVGRRLAAALGRAE